MNVPRPRRTRFGGLVATGLAALLAATTVAAAPALAVVEEEAAEAKVLIFTKTTQFRHTEAIVQGTPALQAAFTEAGIESDHTEDSSVFNDANLAQYDALVMFQTSGDPWNAEEKAALERYQQAGGGIVAIHNATDMRGNYEWWDEMIGALMPGHAATGNSPGLPGTVRVEDRTHPSTEHLPQRWDRADEWYNYSANVRGEAHVLATMDESTYDAGGNAMGADHPISWCRGYDGGRSWTTGMGHFGAHFTDEPDLVQHILGGVEWAAGLAEGDCGGTDWSEFEKVSLDSNTSAPFAMDVAPDGRVFFTELVRGQIRVYDPTTQVTSTAVTLPVYSGGEDGLLGIALDPDFAENGWVYVYYAPASADDRDPANFYSQVSRFTVQDGSVIDPASEEVLLEVPARRLPDEPGHTGGGLAFDNDGNLLLGVGDDVNPHSEPSGGYAPLSERDGTFHDARATSANTNDLRGKLLRITPQDDGTYTVPEGNLIDSEWAADKDQSKILPEIYAMGFRNPFRFSVDPLTGHIGMADYSPDNGTDAPATRGPAGIGEWNLITEPGNYGWPLCMGANEPFRDVDYRTNPVTVGPFFDCDAPVNDSIRNTGLTELPPAKPADLFYGSQRNSAPGIITGGGVAPMGGPFYDFDADLDSDTKFPEYYEGKPFFYEWARNRMFSLHLTDAARAGEAAPGDAVENVTPFLPPPAATFAAPIDSSFGPDGSLYVLDWGGGYGRDNPDSGLHRIDYISGSRSPAARITTDVDSGPAPLTVTFSGESSTDPEGEDLTYAWDFDGDGTTDSTEATPTYTYSTNGVYNARLTVTDPAEKSGTATVPITVGNTRPQVEFVEPPHGGFFDFGDPLDFELDVSDVEDGEVDPQDVIIQPALGHDAHAHPAAPVRGTSGTIMTELGGGHAEDMNVFYVLDARYTDSGAEGVPALTGSDTVQLYPRLREAEFNTAGSDDLVTSASGDAAGHGPAVGGSNGAWASYDPVNLRDVDALVLRAASAAGGTIELRRDAPDGALVGTADVPATRSLSRYVDVRVPVTDPGETFELFLVMTGPSTTRVNFMEAKGKALSPSAPAEVLLTAPTPWSVLDPGIIQLTADASVGEGEISKVEFLADGEVIGSDTTAPYTLDWDVTEERRYELAVRATTSEGDVVTSRGVVVDVGDLFAGWETYTHPNAAAEFDRPDSDTWVVNSGGANMWQGTDEYGAAFRPAGAAGEQWTATVRVDSQGNTNNGAKAGLIVRNDITAPNSSPGYGAVGIRPGGGFEWLRDGDGNGTLDASTAGGTTGYPAWVRLVRDGSSYQASWSRDGVTFTPMGGPVQLAGAADVQDIGLFVTAHSATAKSEVTFSDFTFVEGGPEPEPEPEPLPPCVGTNGDTFDGDTLDTGVWTKVRQADGSPLVVADGSLQMPVTAGDIDGGNVGSISLIGQQAPDGEWEATTKLTLAHTRHWQHAGLVLHATDDEYVKLAFTRNSNGSRYLEFVTETAGARTWQHNLTLPGDTGSTVWLKLSGDGEGLRASYSLNGTTWADLNGVAPLKEDATIGLVAAGDTAQTEVTAEVDSFDLTVAGDEGEALEPSDEFEGTALDTCRWDAVVRPDGGALEVADGHLSITTQPGDINGAANEDPRNFVLQDLGDGDWTVETRLRATMRHQWQLAGLIAYGDDDNYVKLDVAANNPPTAATNLVAELVSERNGAFGNGGNRGLDIANTSESGYFYLRLTKEGSSYSGWVSEGGNNWTSLGAPVTNDAALTSVGLMAIGPQQVEPVVVDFDYLRVVTDDEEEPDTTAPVLDVVTSPAEPDGLAGWWTSPVSVSATATDDGEGDVLVEHRIGDGAWTPHTGPVVMATDGTYVVDVRATDAAGNVAEHDAFTVKLDTTAPVVEVSGLSDGAEVEQGETVDLTATATDATSGVASVEVEVDGEAVDAATSWVPSRGAHTVRVTATDVAGHVTTTEMAFTVLVTFDGISGELDAMYADGDLSRAQHSRLDAQVVAAERAHARGDAVGTARALDRFEAQVATVRDAGVRAELMEIARELRARFA